MGRQVTHGNFEINRQVSVLKLQAACPVVLPVQTHRTCLNVRIPEHRLAKVGGPELDVSHFFETQPNVFAPNLRK